MPLPSGFVSRQEQRKAKKAQRKAARQEQHQKRVKRAPEPAPAPKSRKRRRPSARSAAAGAEAEPVSDEVAMHRAAIAAEEEELAYLEKKLGLSSSRNKKKLRKELTQQDGWDDDFVDWLDTLGGSGSGSGSGSAGTAAGDEEPPEPESDDVALHRAAIAREEAEVAYLESKLGLKGGGGSARAKKKLRKEFKDQDGFDDDMVDWLDSLGQGGGSGSGSEPEPEPEMDSDVEEMYRQQDVELPSGSGGESDSESVSGSEAVMDSDVEEMYRQQGVLSLYSEGEEESGSGSGSGEGEVSDEDVQELAESSGSEAESGAEEAESEPESEPESDPEPDQEKTDIYGRPVNQPAKKYVPPHLRRDSGQEAQAKRALQGLLNRVSENTLEPIASQILEAFSRFPRSVASAALCDLVMQSSAQRAQLVKPVLAVNAGIVAALHAAVGSEVSGRVVEAAATRLAEQLDGQGEEGGEEAGNVLLLLGLLYELGVLHCSLVFDLVRLLVDRFGPRDVELLLLLLTHVGPQLRADDASALGDVVALVRQKLAADGGGGEAVFQGRARFALDTLLELKNNKRARREPPPVLATIARIKKRRRGPALVPLHVSWEDLRSAETRGRWWVQGATWSQSAGAAAAAAAAREEGPQRGAGEAKLLKLAASHHMNTDVRRAVFLAIAQADDFSDAFERIAKLGLKNKQEREIVSVLVYLCGQERSYNRFYGLLANRLCEHRNSVKFTLQLAFWDSVKQLRGMPARRVSNLALLFADAVLAGSLSLASLKVMPFEALPRAHLLFLCIALHHVFAAGSDKQVYDAFARLGNTPERQEAVDGLAVVLAQHKKTIAARSEDRAERSAVRTRIKIAAQTLSEIEVLF